MEAASALAPMRLGRCQVRLATTFYSAAHVHAVWRVPPHSKRSAWQIRRRTGSSGCPAGAPATTGCAAGAPARAWRSSEPGAEEGRPDAAAGGHGTVGTGAQLGAPPRPAHLGHPAGPGSDVGDGVADAPRALAASGHHGGPDSQEDAEGDIPPEVSELFDILRGEALRRLEEFGPIHLFSLCWAYSTARLLDVELQRRIATAALRLGGARDGGPRAGGGLGAEAAARAPDGDAGALDARDPSGGSLGAGDRRPPPAEAAARDLGGDAGAPRGGSEVDGPPPPPRGADGAGGDGPEQPYALAEGQHWLALYKPPFWQVNVDSKEAARAAAAPFEEDEDGDGDDDDDGASEEHRKRPRVQGWIRQRLAPQHPICTDPVEAHGLLHRLDMQTSGILLCAKTYVGAYWLRLQWCSYLVDKEYVCLVHGWVDRRVREVHKRIRVEKRKAPNSRRTISTHCSVGANGKPSYTEVCTLAHLARPAAASGAASDEPYSLVVLKLHTGRTHQIRVHMQSIGHPLVCDIKYGEERFAADRLWCPRNFLHTYSLGFHDIPEGPERCMEGSPVKLNCPLPEDLHTALATLSPVDDVSVARCEEWLSRDTTRLRSFEDYASEIPA
mmetsp:Transcript_10016/g.31379  ORF Transcript_10016/g.31379 Transcript_10016/m.31379 type:complete len:613 (-) Transcript_10016:39-1877(-)